MVIKPTTNGILVAAKICSFTGTKVRCAPACRHIVRHAGRLHRGYIHPGYPVEVATITLADESMAYCEMPIMPPNRFGGLIAWNHTNFIAPPGRTVSE
jgi:hypothetical protein